MVDRVLLDTRQVSTLYRFPTTSTLNTVDLLSIFHIIPSFSLTTWVSSQHRSLCSVVILAADRLSLAGTLLASAAERLWWSHV